MKIRRILLVGALLVLALVLLLGQNLVAPASTLSRGPEGWLAMRRYLESSGAEARTLDLPLREAEIEGVLVLAFPWQRAWEREDLPAVLAHLRRGGEVILGISSRPSDTESHLLEALDFYLDSARGTGGPPLLPWVWWKYRRQSWRLEAVEGEGLPDLVLPVPEKIPTATTAVRALYEYRGEGHPRPLIFSAARHGGRVWVVPAAIWANARLADAGHTDLLASFLEHLGPRWSFDEYHHGVVQLEAAAQEQSTFAWDLFAAHLLVIYLAGMLAVARRFGPEWRDALPQSGSAAAFLTSLGALHRRLGHHRGAGERMIQRARRLQPALAWDAPSEVDNDGELLELARRLSKAQQQAGK